MKRRIMIKVSGRVQGVNFRRYTQLTAQQLGVCGWVRNLPTGEVEGCFEGESSSVESLVEWCRTGPPASRVEYLDIQEQPFTGEFAEFRIRY